MKQFITNIDGGQPVYWDDFRWIMSGEQERFAALLAAIQPNIHPDMSALPPSTAIITGCNVTLSNLNTAASWSSGIVMINGVFYTLPASTTPLQLANPGTERWFIVPDTSAFAPAGNKTFNDGNTHDTYEIRRARVDVLAYPQSNIALLNGPRFMYGITGADYVDTNLSVTGSGWSGSIRIGFNALGEPQFKGALTRTNVNADLVCTLPVRFRPQNHRYLLVVNGDYQTQGAVAGTMQVMNTGEVYIYSQNPLVGDYYDLYSLSFTKPS